jgi:hypothetical protein
MKHAIAKPKPNRLIFGSVAKIWKQVFLTFRNRGFPPFLEGGFRQKPIFATEPSPIKGRFGIEIARIGRNGVRGDVKNLSLAAFLLVLRIALVRVEASVLKLLD